MDIIVVTIFVCFLVSLFLVPVLFAARMVMAIGYPLVREEIWKKKWRYFLWLIASILSLSALFPGSGNGALRAAKTNSMMEQIQTAILAYQTEYNVPPPGKDNASLIKELIEDNPRAIAFLNLKPNDMNAKGEVIDPWGTPFRITIGDSQHLRIQSAGPDQKWNTTDDMDKVPPPPIVVPIHP